ESRLGFGRERLFLLIADCLQYIECYDVANPQLQHAIDVIGEYKKSHVDSGFSLDERLIEKINHLQQFKNKSEDHRQISKSNIDYFKHQSSSFDLFSNSRFSLRNYSEKMVPIDIIESALILAQNAPSACNRQTVRTHVFTDPEWIEEILVLQGGNRGFGHLSNKLIIRSEEHTSEL